MSNGITTFTPGLEEKKENNSLVRSASVWSLKRCGLCPFAKALKLYLVWNAWFVEMEQTKNEDICWIAKFNALEREDVLDCMIWIVDWLGTNLHAYMPRNYFVNLVRPILPCQRGDRIKFCFLAIFCKGFLGFDFVTGISGDLEDCY